MQFPKSQSLSSPQAPFTSLEQRKFSSVPQVPLAVVASKDSSVGPPAQQSHPPVVVVVVVLVVVVDGAVVVVDGAVVVVDGAVVVVAAGASSATRSAMNSSTVISMAFSSPIGMRQSPLSSAFAHFCVNLSSAFCRQAGSTARPFLTAFEWHLALPKAFLPASLYFAAVHLLGPGPPSAVTRSSMRTSTLASMAVSSPVVRQPPLASALAHFALNLPSTFSKHRRSTPRPFLTAFEWHLALPKAFLPASLYFAAAHLLACAAAGPLLMITTRAAASTVYKERRMMLPSGVVGFAMAVSLTAVIPPPTAGIKI
jgi:hypothetical protein